MTDINMVSFSYFNFHYYTGCRKIREILSLSRGCWQLCVYVVQVCKSVSNVCVCVVVCVCIVFIIFHYVFHTELEETEQVRRWTLARGEDPICSLLSQLWPAVPSTTGVWGTGQKGQATGRSLDS